jgi:hypothetical protein
LLQAPNRRRGSKLRTTRLERAGVVLLLVSADFLASVDCSTVERYGWLAPGRHDVHVFVVEPIQDPNILSDHAMHKRARRREARLAIRDSGKAIGLSEPSNGCKHRPISRRPLVDSERREGSTKCCAQPRDSSGQGDSPFAMQRSSCSALSSM